MKRLLASILLSVAPSTIVVTGLAASAGLLAACNHQRSSFVKVDDVALGRVVVYRNGVAYYERRAMVEGGQLTVNVPRDKVDDFLKSLTVVDARTQQALPVSFPRQQSDHGGYIEMALEIPTKEPVELVLTYVTEAPAWKPSYRVAVGDGGKVMMEGWAIVDNTSGEDWNDVTVGVGSSSALSFHYDLWSVRSVSRATLATEDRFAVAPPTAMASYGGSGTATGAAGGGGEAMVAQLDDTDIVRPAGHPEAEREQPAEPDYAPSPSMGRDDGDYDESSEYAGGQARSRGGAKVAVAQPVAPPRSDAKLDALAPQLARSGDIIVIRSFADASRAGADERAKDRANLVRDKLIDRGVAPAQIQIETSVAAGSTETTALVQRALSPEEKAQRAAAGDPSSTADTSPVGESHFQSETPMTVGQGTSVMVPMVRSETDGAQVYLYDPESERGNEKFAFKAIRIKNPTDSTLETGPVTVYGEGRFIGEGLTEPIPPHASAVVPFALDRQVIVEHGADTENRISKLLTLQRGVLTAEVQHLRRKHFTITSRLREPTRVFVRHTVAKGWNLIEAPEMFERIGDAHLFEVEVPAQGEVTVEILEATPMTRTLDLTSTVALDMMKVYVDSPVATPALQAQLRELLATHRLLMDAQDKLASLALRLADYRQRMDELHGQLLTLQVVKTGGDLMKHLRTKMKEISDRVQASTIEQVDTQEQIMLARIRFQDQLAELRLEEVKPAAAGSASAPVAAATR
jgi:hypothetical protein